MAIGAELVFNPVKIMTFNPLYRIRFLFIAILLIACTQANPLVHHDRMCTLDFPRLCVSDVLKNMTIVLKKINQISLEIEKWIINHVTITGTLNNYVGLQNEHIREQLPKPKYHVQFFETNHINQNELQNLVLEAHYAMSFYYKSIQDILDLKNQFTPMIDNWFKDIQKELRWEVICEYRRILDVYSTQWPSINDIPRIQFSPKISQASSSLIHNAHSIVIARLLSEWMPRLTEVLINIKMKLL